MLDYCRHIRRPCRLFLQEEHYRCWQQQSVSIPACGVLLRCTLCLLDASSILTLLFKEADWLHNFVDLELLICTFINILHC